MGILSYTMEQIVDKASIAIQSTKLFSQAFLQWNVLLFKNKTWSDLKYHFCKGIQILPRHGSGHIGGEHCCEKNGDALKAAMLAKLPDGVRTNDFDLLVYYLRGDLLGCPSGRDGYSYFGTTPPNRAAPAFKVRRDT